MAFQQFKLDKSVNQSRGIFDKYIYNPDNNDLISDIITPSYFGRSRFINDEEWVGSIIEVSASDGYAILRIVNGGTVTLYDSTAGSSLTPEQVAALNSILNLSDTYVPIKSDADGGLVDSQLSQLPDGTLVTPGVIQSGTNTFKLGEAWLFDSAGRNIRYQNINTGENFNPVFQNFSKDRHPAFVRVRQGNPLDSGNDYSLPINVIDTDVLTNPTYTVVIPSIGNEEGQTATTALVKIDPSSSLTNWNLKFTINGTDFTTLTLASLTSGDFLFDYEPEIDFKVGDVLMVTITSDDGDVKMLGDNITGFPYLIQNVQTWNDKRIYHLQDDIPTYKDANTPANELFINDAETIAADTSSGSVTLAVDDGSLDWFNVFDYAGNWSFSNRVTLNFNNGDTYTLTRRRRRYFFYKDAGGLWNWYYTDYRAG